MGITQGSSGQGIRPPLPRPGSERQPATPFWTWASKNRARVVIAVLGGLALNVVNAWGFTLHRPGASPEDLARRAEVQIEAQSDVCWKATLEWDRRTVHGCGDAAYQVKAVTGMLTYPPDTRFFASVYKTYRKKVTGQLTIVLVVHGQVVDEASTSYETATVSY